MVGRIWRRGSAAPSGGASVVPGEAARPPMSAADDPTTVPGHVVGNGAPAADDVPEGGPLPEQPVPLPALPGVRPARTGVLLPARSARSPLALPALPVPRVPKRAILAVGVCAGLAAPAITRQIAGRALAAVLGADRRPARPSVVGGWEGATLEIIRITYRGPRQGEAAAMVGRLLDRLK
jgi:hypothetical protein